MGDEQAKEIPPKRILLVDDDQEIVESMRMALESSRGTRFSSPAMATKGWPWPSARTRIC